VLLDSGQEGGESAADHAADRSFSSVPATQYTADLISGHRKMGSWSRRGPGVLQKAAGGAALWAFGQYLGAIVRQIGVA